MAQEGSDASVASSSPAPSWWEINTNPICSWNVAMNHRWTPHCNSSNCEDQEMISNISTTSFTNASNHSVLSMDSSSVELSGEPTENQLWSQVLSGVENNGGDLHNNDGQNFLDMLSSKNLATELFNPACDYLKKLDSNWEFINHAEIDHTQIDNLEKHLMSSYNGSMIEPSRLTNLSEFVNWSIAPPNTTSNSSQFNHEKPSRAHDNQHNIKASESSLPRQFGSSATGLGQQVGLNNSLIGLSNNIYCNGVSSNAHWSNNARASSDLLSFSGKPSVKGSELSKKQRYETSSSTKGSGRVGGTSDGKKKRSEESPETALVKKSKHENSHASSTRIQPPKVKLQEKISALQQIVSPFGKTDTASVLMEAINYIGFLHEQVQLLSDPYMKSGANKDHNSWGGLERKGGSEPKLDLSSRGLCLVPLSCTPQIYRENTGPDYWPTYRGCLFR